MSSWINLADLVGADKPLGDLFYQLLPLLEDRMVRVPPAALARLGRADLRALGGIRVHKKWPRVISMPPPVICLSMPTLPNHSEMFCCSWMHAIRELHLVKCDMPHEISLPRNVCRLVLLRVACKSELLIQANGTRSDPTLTIEIKDSNLVDTDVNIRVGYSDDRRVHVVATHCVFIELWLAAERAFFTSCDFFHNLNLATLFVSEHLSFENPSGANCLVYNAPLNCVCGPVMLRELTLDSLPSDTRLCLRDALIGSITLKNCNVNDTDVEWPANCVIKRI
jgi:hypothetical protein